MTISDNDESHSRVCLDFVVNIPVLPEDCIHAAHSFLSQNRTGSRKRAGGVGHDLRRSTPSLRRCPQWLRVFRHAIEFVVPVHRCLKGFAACSFAFMLIWTSVKTNKRSNVVHDRKPSPAEIDRQSSCLAGGIGNSLSCLSLHTFFHLSEY